MNLILYYLIGLLVVFCNFPIAMHFSKTYIQLLEDLPPELQVNVIQYRQVCLVMCCGGAS